jgi:hypothetical protein
MFPRSMTSEFLPKVIRMMVDVLHATYRSDVVAARPQRNMPMHDQQSWSTYCVSFKSSA